MLQVNKNLLIRNFEQNDLDLLWRWHSAAARGPYQEWEFTSRANLEQRFQQDGYNGPGFKILLIEHHGQPVGLFYLSFRPTGNDVRVCSLGLNICEPDKRRQGLGVAVARAMVDYLFNNYTTFRLEADVDVDNTGARRVLEQCGFSREGVLRQYRFHHGRHRDFALYSLLRLEWELAGD